MEVGIIDIETTHLDPRKGFIVELGCVSWDVESGFIMPVWSTLIREHGFKPPFKSGDFGWIFKNSNLTPALVEAAHPMAALRDDIQSLLFSFPLGVTAFNKKFDFGFLRDRGFDVPDAFPCIMEQAAHVMNLPPVPGSRGPKFPSVVRAWNYFFPSRPFVEAHRGLEDAFVEALIAREVHKVNPFLDI